MHKCKHCGKKFEGSSCPNCGSESREDRLCPQCGKQVEDSAKLCPNCGCSFSGEAPKSAFTGGAFANFFIKLVSNFVSLFTLGLLAPAMICWKHRWLARHTYVNGKQQYFDGKGIQLFGKYLLWLFLSVITFGIFYIFFMEISVERWITRHTHFVGDPSEGDAPAEAAVKRISYFDGTALQLFGVKFLTRFVSFITLSFGSYWATCYKERWLAKHTVIDGYRLYFDGKAVQLFGKTLLWGLLTFVTLGIYSFWHFVKQKNWFVFHTRIAGDGQKSDWERKLEERRARLEEPVAPAVVENPQKLEKPEKPQYRTIVEPSEEGRKEIEKHVKRKRTLILLTFLPLLAVIGAIIGIPVGRKIGVRTWRPEKAYKRHWLNSAAFLALLTFISFAAAGAFFIWMWLNNGGLDYEGTTFDLSFSGLFFSYATFGLVLFIQTLITMKQGKRLTKKLYGATSPEINPSLVELYKQDMADYRAALAAYQTKVIAYKAYRKKYDAYLRNLQRYLLGKPYKK